MNFIFIFIYNIKTKNTKNDTNMSKSFKEFTLLSYEITKNLDIKTFQSLTV